MPKNIQEFTPAALQARLLAAGFETSTRELADLFAYLKLLQKWNKVMNLVGPYAWPQLVNELILDSFHLADFIRTLPMPERPEAWDFGAGAGLPGIPLRILWQAGNYSLVDSREKRVMFLQNVLASLNLPGTKAQAARVENFMATASPADLLLSRAFMPWQKLLELVKGKLAPGAVILFMALEPAPKILPGNYRLHSEKSYQVPAGTRYFWAVSGF